MTTWSAGPTNATAEKITLPPGVTFRTTLSDMKISMNMADGATRPNTAPSGFRLPLSWGGRRTATAIGSGFHLGATPGERTRPGVLRRSPTAAGLWVAGGGGVGRAVPHAGS